mmetsp:Transcript_32633/g.79407  ORF Transcript_32633/g.79407 Transcript_32633/m.79407 type:complete len:207 (+) Transcript_32633:1215-1835(+)
MRISTRVHVRDSMNELPEIVLGNLLRELCFLYMVEEVSLFTEFKYHVHFRIIVEYSLKANNMGVLPFHKLLVYFNLLFCILSDRMTSYGCSCSNTCQIELLYHYYLLCLFVSSISNLSIQGISQTTIELIFFLHPVPQRLRRIMRSPSFPYFQQTRKIFEVARSTRSVDGHSPVCFPHQLSKKVGLNLRRTSTVPLTRSIGKPLPP